MPTWIHSLPSAGPDAPARGLHLGSGREQARHLNPGVFGAWISFPPLTLHNIRSYDRKLCLLYFKSDPRVFTPERTNNRELKNRPNFQSFHPPVTRQTSLHVEPEQNTLASAPSHSSKYLVKLPEMLILLCVLITQTAGTNAKPTPKHVNPSSNQNNTFRISHHLHPSSLTHCEVISPLSVSK